MVLRTTVAGFHFSGITEDFVAKVVGSWRRSNWGCILWGLVIHPLSAKKLSTR